jgi:uncharacterized membrane protein YhhN
LLGHLSYVVACGEVRSPLDWLTDAHAFSLIPIAVALTALQWLWPRLGSMRIPVVGYMLAIVAMMIGAIAVARAGSLPTRTCLVAGAALFFASDLAVARDKFVEHSFTNRAWGLPAYYAGQLLIAWSVTSLLTLTARGAALAVTREPALVPRGLFRLHLAVLETALLLELRTGLQ